VAGIAIGAGALVAVVSLLIVAAAARARHRLSQAHRTGDDGHGRSETDARAHSGQARPPADAPGPAVEHVVGITVAAVWVE
jgi:hypothetical protein